ncbi:hypothetical protein ACFXI8_06600 [Streptomyces niveus]|uniref:hypothetical protein n=1 Tax=Streptomyces niveus TaxID=193462 RepID=UPI0036C1F5BF
MFVTAWTLPRRGGRIGGSAPGPPAAMGRQLAGLIPGAEPPPVAGAGRLLQEDAPAEPTLAPGDFLRTAP